MLAEAILLLDLVVLVDIVIVVSLVEAAAEVLVLRKNLRKLMMKLSVNT
jgi:hypothetical protein